ncbi:DDE-type integrase/transposase/recombinase [Streptomyces sp. NBC_00316]|uniref:DDE-type integrase/transposase/recombinase n=1 Tax=Streptomyces sp. NBC_00316 TaxID=2975710 RepID=UPI002E2E7486|nr:DDE-type integrase/transposase/recombinase [Streptomyces sp. NBC_00316]
MEDRSSRPHHQPLRTPVAVEQQVIRLRREHRIGPLRPAARAGVAASTAHRILRRHGLPVLAVLDGATGEPIRRYERARPGELIHIDVKKLGRIPNGGGHTVLGRAAGSPDKDRRNGGRIRLPAHRPDDHTRLAYTEDLPDETAPTCAGFLTRATAWFAARGITVESVLTDNAWAYTKKTWRQTCCDLGISPRWTCPWRLQTNGEVERFPAPTPHRSKIKSVRPRCLPGSERGLRSASVIVRRVMGVTRYQHGMPHICEAVNCRELHGQGGASPSRRIGAGRESEKEGVQPLDTGVARLQNTVYSIPYAKFPRVEWITFPSSLKGAAHVVMRSRDSRTHARSKSGRGAGSPGRMEGRWRGGRGLTVRENRTGGAGQGSTTQGKQHDDN